MPTKRKAITKKTRFEIFKRDSFTCQYCGTTPPNCILEIDHIFPVCEGGNNDEQNLITSCYDCNRGKGGRNLKNKPKSLKKIQEDDRIKFEQLEKYNKFLMDKRNYITNQVENIGLYYFNKFKDEKNKWIFANHRIASIKTFLNKLTEAEILDSIDITFNTIKVRNGNDYPAWKYFCGVCWNKIKGINHE